MISFPNGWQVSSSRSLPYLSIELASSRKFEGLTEMIGRKVDMKLPITVGVSSNPWREGSFLRKDLTVAAAAACVAAYEVESCLSVNRSKEQVT